MNDQLTDYLIQQLNTLLKSHHETTIKHPTIR
jgi:hypothetical protein